MTGKPPRSAADPRPEDAVLEKSVNDAKVADPRTLAIYVRKGTSDAERWLSIRIPEGIDSLELLEAGFAIDGNQALVSISQTVNGNMELPIAFMYPIFEPRPSRESTTNLPEALRLAEVGLAKFLQGRGFNVTFK